MNAPAAAPSPKPTETCVGCAGRFPVTEGPTHRYLASAPGCWALYGDVLAKEYSRRAYFEVHGLSVDTYAVQHPGEPSRQTIRSAAIHLLCLHAVVELGLPLASGDTVRGATKAGVEDAFVWLEPPASMGTVTVLDVAAARDAADHQDRVWRWARSVWEAWAPHHETIAAWYDRLDVGGQGR